MLSFCVKFLAKLCRNGTLYGLCLRFYFDKTIIVTLLIPMQFFGWVALFYIYIYDVLDDIITKLHCSMLYI